MVHVHLMRAGEGDFIWLNYGENEKRHNLLIDGGVKSCGEKFADVPESFQMYSDLVADEFDRFRRNCIRNWKNATEKIIDIWNICPKSFIDETDSSLVCEGDRRFCNEFWKGKRKELVILCQVLEKEKEQLLQPRVQIFDKVTLEYICTEYRAEYILGNLIKEFTSAYLLRVPVEGQ